MKFSSLNKNFLKAGIIDWLLDADISLHFQTRKYLLEEDAEGLVFLQNRIQLEGWGKKILTKRRSDGHWGRGYYQPKWTSTHYTLLDLRNLEFPKENPLVNESVDLVLRAPVGTRGGINLAKTIHESDVCINGMILNYSSYFLPDDVRLKLIVDYLLEVKMGDGGWNCAYLKGASHSSLHTTLSVLEGLNEFKSCRVNYRLNEIILAEKLGIEFLLVHHLYKSHRTGKIIDPKMLRLSYPSRWRYDILRALDYFQKAKIKFDHRMSDALNVIKKKQYINGTWLLQAPHEGEVHFEMEKVGKPSRWNTLRALRVLQFYEQFV